MAHVRFSHPHRGHKVDDVVEMPDPQAQRLVNAGVARYTTERTEQFDRAHWAEGVEPAVSEPPTVSEDDGDDGDDDSAAT